MPTERLTTARKHSPFASLQSDGQETDWQQSRQRLDDAALVLYVARRELSDEAVCRDLNSVVFKEWMAKKTAPYYGEFRKAVREANNRLPEVITMDRANEVKACMEAYATATLRLADQLKSLELPPSFQGRMTHKVVDDGALLRTYNCWFDKGRTFLRCKRRIGRETLHEMMLEFIDVHPKDRDLLEARKPGQFAEAVVAREFDLSRSTVHKRLGVARRAAGHSRLKSRLAHE